jgi:hypothetical protein
MTTIGREIIEQFGSATALTRFKRCAEDASEGTYEDAKSLNSTIGDAVDQLMRDLRALGLKADTCDHAYALEAAIYDYVKQSNPDASLFAVSEGFGSAVDGVAGERVLNQARQDRDFLRNIGAVPN